MLAGKPKIIVPDLNLAVCWELSIDLFDWRQSAGNKQDYMLVWNLRDCAPELLTYSTAMVFKPKLGSYLAGLIEGDGTIIVPKKERSEKGKIYYPSIQIAFAAKDIPLFTMLLKIIGHGSISKRDKSAAYILTINSQQGLLQVVSLIKGHMRTPKWFDLSELINWLNAKDPSLQVITLLMDTSSLISNSWLSGFIEAGGSFQVRTSLKSKYTRLGCSLEISQARTAKNGHDTSFFLKSIAELFSVSVNSIRSDRVNPQYRIRTSTVQSNLALIRYLDEFPLYSSKRLDYLDWRVIVNYFLEGTQRQNSDSIFKLKSQMNDHRTNFNWNHLIELDNF